MATETEGFTPRNDHGGDLYIMGGQHYFEIGTQDKTMRLLSSFDLPLNLSALAEKLFADRVAVQTIEGVVVPILQLFSKPRTPLECTDDLQAIATTSKDEITALLKDAERAFLHRWQDHGPRQIALASRVSTLQRAAARLSGNPWRAGLGAAFG